MIPEMPADWWPDRITVRGTVMNDERDKWLELSFMMHREDAEVPACWSVRLEALRMGLWNAMHAEIPA